MFCKCNKWKIPEVISAGTKPVPSGLDVQVFALAVQCPECSEIHLLEFDCTREHFIEHIKGGDEGFKEAVARDVKDRNQSRN